MINDFVIFYGKTFENARLIDLTQITKECEKSKSEISHTREAGNAKFTNKKN